VSGPDGPTIFQFSSDDPLAAEHALVCKWVREAIASTPVDRYYQDVDLKNLPSGRELLASSPARGRLLVQAAVAQAKFWHASREKIRDHAVRDGQGSNLARVPGWSAVLGAEYKTLAVIGALLRRSLPLDRTDLLQLLEWLTETGHSYGLPIGQATKSLERYTAKHGIDPEIQNAARRFAAKLRQGGGKDANRLATAVDQICAALPQQDDEDEPGELKPAPVPSPAGDQLVLVPLKVMLGMLPAEAASETTVCGPDRYAMLTHSPLASAHVFLTRLLEEKIQAVKWGTDLDAFGAGQAILGLDRSPRSMVLVAAMERNMASLLGPSLDYNDELSWKSRGTLPGIVSRLGREPVSLNRALLFDLILYLAMQPYHTFPHGAKLSDESDASLLETVGTFTDDGRSLTEGERFVLALWRLARVLGPHLGTTPRDIARLTRWIGDRAKYFLVPGESWSDALNADIAALPEAQQNRWVAVLRHGLTATGARPSAKWLKAGSELVATLGEAAFREAIEAWLPRVGRGRSHTIAKDPRGIGDTIHDENANVLRSFLWLLPLLKRRDGDARLAAAVAFSAYRKVPGVGPRAVKVGNAAVYALSEMVGPEAMGQLAMLKVRVRFGTAQKEVEKAFDTAARELQLPREEIEELSVPDCGLTSVGVREDAFGDYRVRVEVKGSDVEVSWFDGKGKSLKSIPVAVKKEHAEDWKDLQGDIKDLQALISAQKDRIDGLFLEQKTWPAGVWRERYIDHPVVGTIGRRLIWCVDGVAVTMIQGQAEDLEAQTIAIGDDSTVTLWHPAGRNVEEVVAWRRRIESLGIVQPFKQAHREVYLVTDAERRTERYSNRFAAHILRQHQFNALCGARGWKNKLRLMVDDEYPPASRELAAWGIRAEFWIEGVGDAYGQDTNEAGTYLRLASDQVRFYRTGAAPNTAHAGGGGYRTRAFGPGAEVVNEPVRMDEVPTLVFSEIMRDVDLFVGVASIGNDPTWQDGGRETRYGEYWRNYSFGELSATAISRRETLERLIPRLKIADKCVLSDRFLLVQGTRRRYKIHLGSGNILMEPNDQYLCIVPDARARAGAPQVYLPFEGDATLSIILSKAFLLAEDRAIKDPVILRQLGE
jgi:Domain of unknown function (DUF4132)